jgi:hypothetical protein
MSLHAQAPAEQIPLTPLENIHRAITADGTETARLPGSTAGACLSVTGAREWRPRNTACFEGQDHRGT